MCNSRAIAYLTSYLNLSQSKSYVNFIILTIIYNSAVSIQMQARFCGVAKKSGRYLPPASFLSFF